MNNTLSYIKTCVITFIIVVFLAFIPLILDNMFNINIFYLPPKFSKEIYEENYIGYDLYLLTEKKLKNPKDYKVNLDLGKLYDELQLYNFAEKEYKEAIEKASWAYEPKFKLARNYVQQKDYNLADVLVSQIEDTSYSVLVYNKAVFYEYLADALFQDKNYEKSFEYYKIAANYFSKIQNEADRLVNKIVETGIKLADTKVENNLPEQAIDQFLLILQIKDLPIVKYKLALLYEESNPVRALQYMESVYKINPLIINYDIYRNLLRKLIYESYKENDYQKAELYSLKLDKLNNYVYKNYVMQDDFAISILDLNINNYFFGLVSRISFKFKIKNNMPISFKDLYITVSYISGDKEIYNKTINIIKKNKLIEPYSFSDAIKIDKIICNFKKDKKVNTKNARVRILIAKKQNKPKYSLGNIFISK